MSCKQLVLGATPSRSTIVIPVNRPRWRGLTVNQVAPGSNPGTGAKFWRSVMVNGADRVKQWRRRMKERIVSAMGGKCQCCGYSNCHDALVLHHLDPEQKEIKIAGFRAHPKAIATAIVELRKCVMLCANCHSEIHAGVRQSPTASSFDEALFKSLIEETQPRIGGRFSLLPIVAIV